MIQLSPSILSADFAHLARDCSAVLDAGADMLHFDVMDGHFVPNISFGLPVLRSLHKALPDALLDVHLMISEPLRYTPEFAAAGAGIITFHYECGQVAETIAAIKAAGCKAGISIKPGTPADVLLPYLADLDLILVMSVEPGFGGQKFMPAALDKLRFLHAACEEKGLAPYLEVDGGVDLKGTGKACAEAGANLLVAGSAVFAAPDPAAAVQAFHAL